MKFLTKNLVYFAIFFILGAFIFRYLLSNLLENRLFTLSIIIAISYGLYNFFIGWFFGKRDYEELPLYDVGFRIHFVTYFLFNIISGCWFLLKLNSKYENIMSFYITLVLWSFAILFHFIFFLKAKKKTIRGLNKNHIFE